MHANAMRLHQNRTLTMFCSFFGKVLKYSTSESKRCWSWQNSQESLQNNFANIVQPRLGLNKSCISSKGQSFQFYFFVYSTTTNLCSKLHYVSEVYSYIKTKPYCGISAFIFTSIYTECIKKTEQILYRSQLRKGARGTKFSVQVDWLSTKNVE